jgi:hypothetical protein
MIPAWLLIDSGNWGSLSSALSPQDGVDLGGDILGKLDMVADEGEQFAHRL